MITLSDIIQTVPPSPTIAASVKANALKSQGRDIVSLTVGEPDMPTPEHVKQAAVEALQKNFTKYTAPEGILPLREAILKKLKRDQKTDFTAKQIVVTNGGKQALAAACAVLLNPGDEVVIPAPYWTSYPDIAKLVGAVPVIVQTTAENGYLMTAEQLISACTARTRIIILCSPSNPTGACYNAEQLKDLVEAFKTLKNHQDITIISDEVYEYITYDGFQHKSIIEVAPELRDNILLVNAFSKSYSMTGWRVGYAAGNQKVIDAMGVHQSQFTSNVCSIAQYAAARAYDDEGAFPKMMQAEFAKRLEIVCSYISKTPGLSLAVRPKGSFFAFIELGSLLGKKADGRTVNCGQDFADYLLEKFDVVVVQGEAFGASTAFRMSFALDTSSLEKGLSRIKQAAESLQG